MNTVSNDAPQRKLRGFLCAGKSVDRRGARLLAILEKSHFHIVEVRTADFHNNAEIM